MSILWLCVFYLHNYTVRRILQRFACFGEFICSSWQLYLHERSRAGLAFYKWIVYSLSGCEQAVEAKKNFENRSWDLCEVY
jgi:hypothetical protein